MQMMLREAIKQDKKISSTISSTMKTLLCSCQPLSPKPTKEMSNNHPRTKDQTSACFR
uniref:Uncharacterized protein n=1 Tax=Rhizophora mucronata TaxID=61149 RepID=A0A2P2INW1_RHIMU